MDVANELRRCRAEAGLTQAALASAAGTSQPTVAAYEAGRKTPSLATLTRLVDATGRRLTVVDARSRLGRAVAEATDLIGEEDLTGAFRVLADVSARLERLEPAEVGSELTDDPGSTGHRRWDALVGGIAERASRHHGLVVPPWTSRPGRFTTVAWFVTDHPALHASALVHTPPELAVRNVFVHADSLSGV